MDLKLIQLDLFQMLLKIDLIGQIYKNYMILSGIIHYKYIQINQVRQKRQFKKAHVEQISEQELQQFQEYLKKDNCNILKNSSILNFNLSEIIEKNINLAFFIFSIQFPNPEFLEQFLDQF